MHQIALHGEGNEVHPSTLASFELLCQETAQHESEHVFRMDKSGILFTVDKKKIKYIHNYMQGIIVVHNYQSFLKFC